MRAQKKFSPTFCEGHPTFFFLKLHEYIDGIKKSWLQKMTTGLKRFPPTICALVEVFWIFMHFASIKGLSQKKSLCSPLLVSMIPTSPTDQ